MKAITSILMKAEAKNVGSQQPMRPWSTFDEERQNKGYRQFWTAKGTGLLSNAEDISVKDTDAPAANRDATSANDSD